MSKRPYRPLKLAKYDFNTARFGGKYIIFRADYFIKDLGKVVEKAVKRVGELIVKQSKNNIAAIRFNSFPVRLAGSSVPKAGLRKFGQGYDLTDSLRKSSLMNSIILDEVKVTGKNKVSAMVKTMVSDFKNSHIGIYYEYGTGQYQSGGWVNVKGKSYEYSPYRIGKHIYTRPGQTWVDLGGNKRISLAGSLRKLDGLAVRAHRWFGRAVEFANASFISIFNQEFLYLDIRKYLQIKPKIVLGRDK